MLKRRDFLKGAIGGVGALCLFNPLSLAARQGISEDSGDSQNQVVGALNPSYLETIVCCFDNPKLKRMIERLAKEINCNVHYCDYDNGCFAIEAGLGFITIVDRKLINREDWDEYIAWCEGNEALKTDPPKVNALIILGLDRNIRLPKNKFVSWFNMKSPYVIDNIGQHIMKIKILGVEEYRKSLIKQARKGNRRLYAHRDNPVTIMDNEPSLQLELKGDKFYIRDIDPV